MRISYLVLIAGLSFACGKIDKTETTQTPLNGSNNQTPGAVPPALLVVDVAHLPACTADNEGQLVYITASSQFGTCASTVWKPVNVAASGGSASAGITSAVYCQMVLPKADLVAAGLDRTPDSGLILFYSITQFAGNMRYIQASVTSGAFTYASGIYWASRQEAYATSLSDKIGFDIAGTENYGYFQFANDVKRTNDNNNPISVTYSDPDLAQGKTITFDTATECTQNVY